jgi:dTDP-4-amino-4,6-dideoxygalactose transaminase
MIPVFRAKLPNAVALRPYLDVIDRNSIYSNFGPLNTLLRERFSEYLSLPLEYIATCSNATLAIEGALSSLDSSFSDYRVRAPSWTFAATIHACHNSNKQVIFGDVDDDGVLVLNSDEAVIRVPVLPFGAKANFRTLRDLREPVIVDAAASFYALSGCGQELTSLKNDTFFVISLHATKSLGAGEGAIVFSNSSEWIERFRRWTNFSFDDQRVSISAGTNAKLSEYNCAVALASLDCMETSKTHWKHLNLKAIEISNEFGINIESTLAHLTPSTYWNIYMDSPTQRDRLEKFLESKNVQTKRWWSQPCHHMPVFNDFSREPLDKTEQLSSVYTALPLHLFLEDEHFEKISNALETFAALECKENGV